MVARSLIKRIFRCFSMSTQGSTCLGLKVAGLEHSVAPAPLIRKPASRTTSMAPVKDVTHLSDIGKLQTERDGSFNRQPSQFRDTIEKGGKFEPEKGGYCSSPSLYVHFNRLVGRYHLYVSYGCREFKPILCESICAY